MTRPAIARALVAARRGAPLLMLLALVAPAPPAAGATVLGRSAGSAGPVVLLDDGGTLWADHPSDGLPVDLLRAGPAGGPARRVVRFSRGGPFQDEELVSASRLAVSGGHALLTLVSLNGTKGKYTGNPQVADTSVLVALRGATVTTVARCGEFGASDVALAWPWLLTAGCGGQPGRGLARPGPVVARDLTRPGGPAQQLSAAGFALQTAGHMVSWREPDGTLVVHDLLRQAEVSRTSAVAFPGAPAAGMIGVHLQPDGGLGVVYAAPDPPHDTQIALLAAGAAAPRIVVPGGQLRAVRVAGERLAFERAERGADRATLVVRAASGEETVVARYLADGAIDFDGVRAAWVRRRCAGSEVVVGRVDGQPTDTQRIDVCPLQLYPDPQAGEYGGTYVDVAARRFVVGAMCLKLLPPRPTDRCRIVARLTSPAGQRYGAARATVRAGRSFSLRITVTRRLLRSRPDRLVVHVATTMRGRTVRTRVTVAEPFYD